LGVSDPRTEAIAKAISDFNNKLIELQATLAVYKKQKEIKEVHQAGLDVARTLEDKVKFLLMACSKYFVEHDPVSMMQCVITDILRDIFGTSIKAFEIETIEKRGQMETYFYITTDRVIDGVKLTDRQPIMDSTGGGLKEVAFFLIRLLVLITHPSNPRKILFADEPVSALSEEHRDIFIDIVGGLAKKFDVQIIMTTHCTQYKDKADQIINIQLKDGVSVVS